MIYPEKDDKKKSSVLEVKPEAVVANCVPKDDTVTLTKSQLQAILEAIGKVNTLSLTDDSQKDVGKEASEKENCKESSSCEAKISPNDSTPPMSDLPNMASRNICPLDILLPDASKQWSPSCQVLQNSPSKSSNLSRLEQKRMQWEREKAEMIDWNPWGRPGAGAPPRRILPVASVAPRTENQLLMVQTNSVPYSSSLPNGIPSCLTSPSHLKSSLTVAEPSSQASPYYKSFSTYSCLTQPVKPVPPVFKSSINFGTIEDDFSSVDGLKKQQWLKDLECQREEQQKMKQSVQAERSNVGPESDWMNGNVEDIDSISISGSAAQCHADGRSYVRGQGFKLDPVSAARAEERRQKAQEYQQAIRQQMEEKQRRLQEEKERKKREEEEEERRLIAERARLQAEYELEQSRLKQKKELEEQKQTALITAVRKAEAEAQAHKKTRKSQKTQPMLEDGTSQSELFNSNSPRKGSSEEISPRMQHKGEEKNTEGVRLMQQTATVRPFQNNVGSQQNVAKTDRSPKKELGVQTVSMSSTEVEEYAGYVVNRVLTPSPYRIKARRGCAKDFGTQTDVNYGRWLGEDAESTDQSNTSSIHPSVGKRFTRVQHSKPYKVSRRDFCAVDSLEDRPKWGQNQPSKSFIRMTDRDPHFSKRRKMQELRKQHWEREMASQQALKNARRSNAVSYRSRRARSSSDGTAGFSSSEASNVRSHSPPHHQTYGFRSVCGSAEDVAYLGPSSAYSSTLLPSVHRRPSQSSDNLPSIICGSEPTPSRLTERFSFPEVSSYSGGTMDMPMRRKWHSHEAFHSNAAARGRDSPPVPTVQRRLMSESKSSTLPSPATHSRRKWSDQESFDLESVAMSRVQSHQSSSEDGSAKNDRDSLSSADSSRKLDANHNPLVCPEVVTRRPTPRQDRILQNLSSLRQGLLQKQKELETLIRNPPHVS